MLALLPLTLSLFLTTSAEAGISGDITFSAHERQRHAQGLPELMATASTCLDRDLQRHLSFYKDWGISPFFGDQSTFGKADGAGKVAYLSRMGFNQEQIDYLKSVMQPTSCIGLTLKCLGQGFAAAGQQDLWDKVRGFTMANDVTGDALLHGLQALGWRVHYWNPDVSRNTYWDEQEKSLNPGNPRYIWGYHEARWQQVLNSGRYLYSRVDDASTLVNFGERSPEILRNVPFFVGLAHGGYHVFPGSYGQIIEAHSTRQLNDRQTVETSPFNPIANGGGPRGLYRSGLIALPPGASGTREERRGPGNFLCSLFRNC